MLQFNIKVNQVWPGVYSCQFSIADFRRTKGRIDLKFTLFVYWLSMKRHRKFQIDLTFGSSEISNWKLAAVDPGSHLIGIYFNSIVSKQSLRLGPRVNDNLLGYHWQGTLPFCVLCAQNGKVTCQGYHSPDYWYFARRLRSDLSTKRVGVINVYTWRNLLTVNFGVNLNWIYT